jgi:UDP-4-amino-4,6-dideoxy-N-acetyl-beta-L-altrosamine transaminase
MTERFLPYGSQWVTDDDINAVESVLRGGWLTTGPAVKQFESDLEQSCGAAFAVAVNSGTAALHCAYHALGLGPGDELITTPLTFAATANAAVYLGASVRFVDVDPDTGTLDPDTLLDAINAKTKVIAAVDYSGHPADYDGISAIAGAKGIAVCADASHSLGATYNGRSVGTLADVTTLSFHPVKVITTGEGGAVLTQRDYLADRARTFRSHGIVHNRKQMRQPGGAWHQEMQGLGFNYRLSDIHCALGSSQLARLDSFMSRRRVIAAKYTDAFSDLTALSCPVQWNNVESAWHLYVLRVADATRREAFFDGLREGGLGVQVHYVPVHHHPFYQDRGHDPQSCPRAVDFSARALSIPIFPRMTDDDVDFVIETVRTVARERL